MSAKIFGYDWEQIKGAQQGKGLHKPLPEIDPVAYRKQLVSDIERFQLPVHRDVAEAYGLEFPEGYVLEKDDVYRFTKPQ